MNFKNPKDTKELLLVPLFFTFIGYLLLTIVLSPILKPVVQVYSLIASNATSEESNRILYSANNISIDDTLHYTEVIQPSIGDQYGELKIDRLQVDRPLYFGDTPSILMKGLGSFRGSNIPGMGYPVLIAGHNLPFFEFLGQVQIGDTIEVATHYGTFIYEIYDTRIARHTDSTAYDLYKHEEELILYTCYPIYSYGYTPDRLFVYARLVSGTTIEGI